MRTRKRLPPTFLNEVAARIHRALGDNLIAIVLFGSYARGLARQGSDFDLLVVARELVRDGKPDKMILYEFDDLRWKLGSR